MQLWNLNPGGQELSFSPPSSPAGHTWSEVVPDACSCTGVVVGWSPTVSQFPLDSRTPDTLKVRDPKTGKVVVVVAGRAVVVVLVLSLVVVVRGRTECGESVRVTAPEQPVHANTTTSATTPRSILTAGS